MAVESTSKAIGWSAIEQFSRQFLYLVISIVLARLIAPAEFGILAILLVFSGLSQLFIDGGMAAALIQSRETTKTDECTVFWFNLLSGFLFALGLFSISGWLSRFYEIPELKPIARVNAILIFLGATNSIHGTLFVKKLDFKRPAVIALLSMAVSGFTAIILAIAGWGLWALVVQGVVRTVFSCALTWTISRWRPSLVFSKESFSKLFRFGGFYFAARLLDVLYQRSYGLLLGKWYGPADLAFYNRADSTQKIPSLSFTSVISRVAFPIFCAASSDPPKLRKGFQKSLRWASLINTPAMLGLVLVAGPLIGVLFGSQWLFSVPILQILALAGLFWPIHLLNLSVLQALGHSGKFLKLEVIKKVIGLTLLLVGAHYGAIGLAFGKLAGSIIALFVNIHYTSVYLEYGAFRQFRDLAGAFLRGLLMMLLLWLLWQTWSFGPVVDLVLLVGGGALVYGGLTIFWCREDAKELYRMVCGFLGVQPKLGI